MKQNFRIIQYTRMFHFNHRKEWKRNDNIMGKNLKGNELGKGFRQRKDGRYEARATVNGKSINIYNMDLKKLKEEFEEQKQLAGMNIDARKQKLTLNEWFEEWFESYKVPRIKQSSIFPMRSKYNSTFGRLLGEKKVTDIRNIDIQNAINILEKEGRAMSSIRDALGRVRDCLEAAKHNRIISENPCFQIVLLAEKKSAERRFLTEQEQVLFLQAVENSWYKEMFYIMFLTGMRVGEVGGLQWSDVDFENRCIYINHSLSCNYEKGIKKIYLSTPKTSNSYRKIPFMGEAEEMFLSQKKKQRKLMKELGARYRNNEALGDLVFVTSMGSPVARHSVEKECKKVVKAINEAERFNSMREQREPVIFEDVCPHEIRHTFCSRCFERDMQPKVVQKLMGHGNYTTTIEIYTHVTEQKMDDEITKFGMAMPKKSIPNVEEGIPKMEIA